MEVVTVRAGHKVLMEVDYSFTDCCRSTRAFREAAQAFPNPLIKYYQFIILNYLLLNLKKT
jgi:hypothetical protein